MFTLIIYEGFSPIGASSTPLFNYYCALSHKQQMSKCVCVCACACACVLLRRLIVRRDEHEFFTCTRRRHDDDEDDDNGVETEINRKLHGEFALETAMSF